MLGLGTGCGAQIPGKGLINHVTVLSLAVPRAVSHPQARMGVRPHGSSLPRGQTPRGWARPTVPGADPTPDTRDEDCCGPGGTPVYHRGQALSSSLWILSSLKRSQLCLTRHRMRNYVESMRQIDSDELRHVKGTKRVNCKAILLLNTVHRVS